MTAIVFVILGCRSLDPGDIIGILLGVPLGSGVLGGIIWWIRSAIRDSLMEQKDLERHRQMERGEDDNREWHAVRQILKQRKENSA
jgi:hypothetical protein